MKEESKLKKDKNKEDKIENKKQENKIKNKWKIKLSDSRDLRKVLQWKNYLVVINENNPEIHIICKKQKLILSIFL